MNGDKKRFLQIFASPDYQSATLANDTLVYYWGSICENGKPSVGSDTCFAKFYFESDKLAKMDFACQ